MWASKLYSIYYSESNLETQLVFNNTLRKPKINRLKIFDISVSKLVSL